MNQDPFGFVKRDETVSYQKMKEMLKQELERVFRPEFINRIDEIVVFHKLNQEHLSTIVNLELAKVQKRLDPHGLTLELSDEARTHLIEKGTDEKFGARPLRRAIESYLEDSLSEEILRGNFRGKGLIKVTVGEDPDNPGEKKFKFEAFDAPADSGGSDEVVAANADAT